MTSPLWVVPLEVVEASHLRGTNMGVVVQDFVSVGDHFPAAKLDEDEICIYLVKKAILLGE